MANEVRNQGSSLAAALGAPKAKSGSNSAVVGTGFSELYKSMDAPRKTPSQLSNSSGEIDKAINNIDEAMDFATKLMLASAKNMGMPNEDGGDNKAQEMTQMAQGIATMMATKAQVQAQMQAIEQQKNPPINLMSLEGKQIECDDSTRSFFGKPVSYNYRVTHNEKDPTASIALTITIRDQNGTAVKTVKQSVRDSGDFSYEWDGKNDGGDFAPFGSYTLDIKAEGRKIVGGKSVPFAATASATIIGEVEEVKIKNGVANGVIINGKTIYDPNILGVSNVEKQESKIPFTADLIGRKVELDFSKANVQAGGSMQVYFNNHIETPGDLTVRIYDKFGKYLTSATSDSAIGVGGGMVSFSNIKLDPAVYDIKVFVKDKENPAIGDVELAYKDVILVSKINEDGTLESDQGAKYDSVHIVSVIGNYDTPLERKAAEYIGSQVVVRDDLFKFTAGDANTSFTFKKPEEDAVVSHGRMDIYDIESGDLVKSISSEYRPYDLLTGVTQPIVHDYMHREFGRANYDTITLEQRLQTNRFIEEGLKKADGDAGALRVLDQHKDVYDKGLVSITFPAWDGQLEGGAIIDSTKQLRRDYTPIYSRDVDSSIFAGDTDKSVLVANVDYVDAVDGELAIHLVGGAVISEDLVLSTRKL